MNFSSTGGIFVRVDPNGNMGIFDQAGTERVQLIGGIISGILNKGTAVSNSPITSTASASQVSLGASAQITPQVSGSILVLATISGSSNTSGDGGILGIWRTTGSNNPAGGAASTGTLLISATVTSTSANLVQTGTVAFLDTGLTVGQAYTYSPGLSTNVGGTFTLTAFSKASVTEI